mmetsp:Transcript_20369/g.63931  ORF Transcript_20369/g.63931 Transcript_20369/m.63931 type:complete len:202 (+) Transcript_20369:482-1087(+)
MYACRRARACPPEKPRHGCAPAPSSMLPLSSASPAARASDEYHEHGLAPHLPLYWGARYRALGTPRSNWLRTRRAVSSKHKRGTFVPGRDAQRVGEVERVEPAGRLGLGQKPKWHRVRQPQLVGLYEPLIKAEGDAVWRRGGGARGGAEDQPGAVRQLDGLGHARRRHRQLQCLSHCERVQNSTLDRGRRSRHSLPRARKE